MTNSTPILSRPVQATCFIFLALSGFVAICLPWQDDLDPRKWPLAFGYCAILAVCAIGIARHGRQGLLLFGLPVIVALLPAVVGIALMVRPGAPLGAGEAWLRLSEYLLYAELIWGGFLSAVGWMMYHMDSEEVD